MKEYCIFREKLDFKLVSKIAMYTTVPSAGKKMAKRYLLQLKNVEEEVSTTHKQGQKKKYKTCLPTFVKDYDLPELY